MDTLVEIKLFNQNCIKHVNNYKYRYDPRRQEIILWIIFNADAAKYLQMFILILGKCF